MLCVVFPRVDSNDVVLVQYTQKFFELSRPLTCLPNRLLPENSWRTTVQRANMLLPPSQKRHFSRGRGGASGAGPEETKREPAACAINATTHREVYRQAGTLLVLGFVQDCSDLAAYYACIYRSALQTGTLCFLSFVIETPTVETKHPPDRKW